MVVSLGCVTQLLQWGSYRVYTSFRCRSVPTEKVVGDRDLQDLSTAASFRPVYACFSDCCSVSTASASRLHCLILVPGRIGTRSWASRRSWPDNLVDTCTYGLSCSRLWKETSQSSVADGAWETHFTLSDLFDARSDKDAHFFVEEAVF